MTRILYERLSGFTLNIFLEVDDSILMRIFNGCTLASSRDAGCFFQGTRTTTNDANNNSRQLLICVFLRFVPRLEQHGCERCAFGKSVSCFFGAETDNDERLVNRENHVLKQTEYCYDFFRALLE